MATVFEEYTAEEQRFVMRFLGKMTQRKGYS
jgi:hypothetical protein